MKLTMRTLLVLVFGVAISLGLYVWLDSAYGSFMGPGGMNTSFTSLISTWRAMGGSAQPITGDRPSFGGGGMPGLAGGFPGGGEHETVSWTHGLELERAPGQTASDLLWLGLPALLGGIVELVVTLMRRRSTARAATDEA
jgi:hypothetical protein